VRRVTQRLLNPDRVAFFDDDFREIATISPAGTRRASLGCLYRAVDRKTFPEASALGCIRWAQRQSGGRIRGDIRG
jgi:hypothetical protein